MLGCMMPMSSPMMNRMLGLSSASAVPAIIKLKMATVLSATFKREHFKVAIRFLQVSAQSHGYLLVGRHRARILDSQRSQALIESFSPVAPVSFFPYSFFSSDSFFLVVASAR
jgi:hypothetical protein